ncbi:glycosyltransferase family 4 protein [Kolteria novifilia]|uniref:glycosyltransferase family 4 protein n=1 Tax=Kolteria novifilia TaxID=2527975 RepID=UPI003AF400EE
MSARYRVAQYARHLEASGFRLRMEPLAEGAVARWRQFCRPRHDQIVLLQRKLLPLWQLLLLRKSTRALIYDFDDAVFFRDSYHRRGPHSLTRAIRFRATVNVADQILAGNSYLAATAGRLSSPEKVTVVPTCVDPSRYGMASHEHRGPACLVWIGSASTLKALNRSKPILERIGASFPGTILRVICDTFPEFEHLRVEQQPWSSATETAQLRSADIGISMLPDDLWSRGKCGLKVLQYMAAGLPVIASPVGVHREIIGQGTGFLPTCEQEWVDHLSELIDNRDLRGAMGREGRQRIEQSFNVDAWGPVIVERVKEAASHQ